MSVEFRCIRCGKLLRTPEATSGQQAKCPLCGTVMTVPEPTQGPASGEHDSLGTDDSANPFQSPADSAGLGRQFGAPSPTAAGIRPTKIGFGDVFGQTWNIFADQWGMCVVVVLLWLVIFGCIVVTLGGGVVIVAVVTESPELFIPLAVLAGCVGAILLTWLGVGLQLLFIKMGRGLDVEIGDLFAGGPYLLRMIGGSVLYSLVVFGILIACVAPCVLIGLAIAKEAAMAGLILGGLISMIPITIFALTFYQFSYLIIDQNLGILDSFLVSREVTSGNRLMMFAIIVVMALVGAAINQVTCNLGTFVVTPITFLLYAVMYLIMIGHPTAGRRDVQPASTPPSPGAD